jgi:tetratricopeptide (TPR) repeat protein
MLTTKNWRARLAPWACGCMAAVILNACTPSGPRALLDGERLLGQGKYSQAISRLQTAVRLLPGNAQAWNHLGLAYHKGGQPSAALKAYEQARRCDPNLTPVRYNLGCLLLEQDNAPLAVSELTTYTLLQRDSVDGWLKLGIAQLRSRQWDAAEQSFQYVLRLEPDQVQAWNGLGMVQVQRRHPREALNYFNTALEKQPNYGAALLNTAILYQNYLNNRAFALERYEAYLKLAPNSSEAPTVQEAVRHLQAELAPPPKPLVTEVTAAPAPAPALSNAPTHTHTPLTAATPRITFSSPATNPPPRSRHSATIQFASAEPAPSAPKNLPEPPKRKAEVSTEAAPAPAPTPLPASVAEPSKPTETEGKPEAPPKPAVVQLSDTPLPKVAEDLSTSAHSPASDTSTPAAPSGSTTVPPTPQASSDQLQQATALLDQQIEQSSTLEPPAREKHPVLRHLNPATWFRGKNRTDDHAKIEPLPADASSPAPPSSVPTSARSNPDTLPTVPPLPPIRHYAYHSPKRPAPGNRSKASPYFSDGVQAQQDGRLSEALDAYRQAAKFDPSFFEAQYNLGLAAYQLKNLALSLSAYETALSINPTSVNARYNFALALEQGSYYEDAAHELEKVLQEKPEEARAHFTVANLYAEKLGQPSLARSHYRRLLQLEPQHPQATAIRYWLAANP